MYLIIWGFNENIYLKLQKNKNKYNHVTGNCDYSIITTVFRVKFKNKQFPDETQDKVYCVNLFGEISGMCFYTS